MGTVKVTVLFKVTVPFRLNNSEAVFVVGQAPELGIWKPQNALKLNRLSFTENNEVWSREVILSAENDHILYRYFIGTVRMSDDEGQDLQQLFISSWESSFHPRSLNLFRKVSSPEEEECIYGRIGGHSRWMRGWLTHQTELQLRFYGKALQWYKAQHRNLRVFLLCRYYTLPTNIVTYHGGGADVDEEVSHDDLDTVEIYVAKASKLTRDGGEFPWPMTPPNDASNPTQIGVEFVSGEDYLTFHVQTVDLENLAVEIEVWACRNCGPPPENGTGFLWNQHPTAANGSDAGSLSSASSSPGASPQLPTAMDLHNLATARRNVKDAKLEQIGVGKILNFEGTKAMKTIHIFGRNRMPIGCMKIEYLVVRPFPGHEMAMEQTFALHWRNRNKVLDVGHRGLGISQGTVATRLRAVRENTIRSFKTAAEHGADFIEFDIHWSKDKQTIVYHDFKVVTVLRKKNQGDLQYLEVPVKQLALKDLQSLKLEDHHVLHMEHSIDVLDKADDDPLDNQPFPTLEQCFELIDPVLGYNIEIKYPQDLANGVSEQEHYFDQNEFVDGILDVVFKHAGGRRVIFSCFDADICIMLSLKQNKYPVMFLTQGRTVRYPEYKDMRTKTTLMGIRFAKSIGILGLCAHSEELLANPALMDELRQVNLIYFVWGEELTDPQHQRTIRAAGAHGLIYDRINECLSAGTLNVFKAEKGLTSNLVKEGCPVVPDVASSSVATSVPSVTISMDTA